MKIFPTGSLLGSLLVSVENKHILPRGPHVKSFFHHHLLCRAGTSMEKGEKAGKLIFLDKETFQRAFEMEVGESHVIRTAWHPKLNQILVGSGDGVVR